MADEKHVEMLRRSVEEWNERRSSNPDFEVDLSGAILSGANLSRANLSRANLSGANLSDASLRCANLSDASLSGASLSGANLSDASLSDANLSDAFLYDANISRANLNGASLSGANLVGAKLNGANLSGAILVGAVAKRANLAVANLSGAKLKEANLNLAMLNEANLNEAKLSYANLSYADIVGADLSGARLTEADLSGANLSGVDLTDATLRGANFSGATLSGANLSRANLSGANLSRANLSRANLSRAVWASCTVGNVDLSEVKGLEDIQHFGPSSIGIDTIEKSGGKIPDVFLRGCGVPEEWIGYLQELAGRSFEFYSAFISYSHADKLFARRLHDQLQGSGIRCWRDEKQMKIGDEILRTVLEAIRIHDRVILCCSKSSLTAPWVEVEIEETLEKEKKAGRAILLPLNLDGFLFDGWKGPLAVQVRKRLAADFTGWETDNAKFEEQFKRVVNALRSEERE